MYLTLSAESSALIASAQIGSGFAWLTTAEPDKGNSEPDSLLDVEAAAQRLGMSKDWLYRDAKQMPFWVPHGRVLRFSSHGIDRYIRTRQNRMPV